MKLLPIGRRVLVREDKPEEKIGRIYMPEASKESNGFGKVVAISKDSELTMLAVGDIVYFGKMSGTDVRLDGVSYLVLSDEEILGVLN